MAFVAGYSTLVSLYRPILSMPHRSHHSVSSFYLLICLYRDCNRKRWFSASTTEPQFAGKNAYDLLGVSETSSFADIKSSFRKLAKETHPDLAQSPSDSSASQRFVQILAAYEILSDSDKRAHYDRFLLSQRTLVQRHSRQGSTMYKYESHRVTVKQMEVVEWLKWYRHAINEIVSEKRVVVGSGYFDILERDFYSAIHAAYYGPEIESMDLLPECFEAEERSLYETPEVLHFVSGRDLFGMVCIADKLLELSQTPHEQLILFASKGHRLCQHIEMHTSSFDYNTSDAYKDLELHVSGRVVAVATRVPPKSYCNGVQNDDSEDHIHIYLNSNEDPENVSRRFSRDSFVGVAGESMVQLGTITGLGTSPEEGSCFVYNTSGIKTHVIMKHRTLLVKHMHWYQMGDEASVCECRCTRARLPPSKFWLFEPRCGMHDIGGWYVETYGRDKKGRNVPSQRYWDGFDDEQFEKRLHPALYLLTLAYRTLDIEDAKRRKQTVKSMFGDKMATVLNWWKKHV
ncbi:hypothetical protein LguiA_006052 [Lonicera macranthoides]